MNEDSKRVLKAVGIGLGIVVGIGAIAAVLSNDTVQEKTEAAINRLRAKSIINKHFNGSDRAHAAVDQMSDQEINNLLDTYDKLSDAGEAVSDKVTAVKDNVTDSINSLLS